MTDRELLYTGLKEFLPEVSEKMIDDLLKFSALLLEKNKVMNLTAVTEPTEVVTRHFLDCAALAPHMPQGGRVLDVGTGAGFPGMPLAILCPETEFVLLDGLTCPLVLWILLALNLFHLRGCHPVSLLFPKHSVKD